MEDFETTADFEQKRELLKLRDRLNQLRKYEQEASELESILSDPECREDHSAAKERLAALKRAIETKKELIAVQFEILNLTGDKLELEKRLAALDD
ncbi:hypothetical protein PMN64_12500 [Bradyrhizobium sp. UFLA01-814]|uniref:hypothetical protein n=1 Tax=Bradyrhizobium sp. UFLA01-814 TaxID=3023480 RepID=UPI00398AC7A2